MDPSEHFRKLQETYFQENEILRDRVATMEAENAAYQDKIEEFKQRLSEKEQSIRDRESKIRSLEELILRKDREIDTLKKSIAKPSKRKASTQKKR